MGNKGSAWERDVSKYLSKWLTGSEKPYQYWRMPGSGMIATISEENVGLTGDIKSLTTESAFLTDIFSLELKTGYPKTSFIQLFANLKNFNIEKFWEQCTIDADKSDKRPMLIYKKLGRKPIVGIDLFVENKFFIYLSRLASMSIRFQDSKFETVVFYDFKDFFDKITPDIIKEKFKDV